MVFSTSPTVCNFNFNIVLDNNNVGHADANLIHPLKRVNADSEVPAIKFLGLFMDESLNFKFHIKDISRK
jgi:hypothetical protein